jgi:hypothetical protein
MTGAYKPHFPERLGRNSKFKIKNSKFSSGPSPQVARRGHSLDGDHIGRITHVLTGLLREIGDCIEGPGHLLVEAI